MKRKAAPSEAMSLCPTPQHNPSDTIYGSGPRPQTSENFYSFPIHNCNFSAIQGKLTAALLPGKNFLSDLLHFGSMKPLFVNQL